MLEGRRHSLSQFADDHLGSWPGTELGLIGPASRKLQEVIQSETHTHPFIGSLFWQAFTTLPAYRRILQAAGLPPGDSERRQEIIVRHGLGGGFWSRLDLVVLDEAFGAGEPASFVVDVKVAEVAETASAVWRESELGKRGLGRGAPARLFAEVVSEVAASQRFGIVVDRPPPTVLTATAPKPAMPIAKAPNADIVASVGVVGADESGRAGVTSADHAFEAAVTDVFVAGLPGTIVSRDPISDSVFIEVPGLNAPTDLAVSGPLSGMTPGEGESVSFDGAQSGAVTTFVTAWDKGIPFEIRPWNRLRVLTEAITEAGDSGAALVSRGNEAIGFAFDRTGLGARIEYSAWIWAEFVYRAHGLQ